MNNFSSALGIDFGLKTVGLALWRDGLLAPKPLEEVQKSGNRALRRILALVDEEKVTLLVVGLPLSAEGAETSLSIEARRFAERLSKRVAIDIVFEDEYGSTAEAQDRLRSSGRGISEHALAAAVILESFLRTKRDLAGTPCVTEE